MSFIVPIPLRHTVVSASRTLMARFSCRSCGFQAAVRVVGRGAAETGAAPFVAPRPSTKERELASRRAVADGQELILLVACPRCGVQDDEVLAAWRRGTRTIQGLVAAVFLALMFSVWLQTPGNAAFTLWIAFPGALAVFLVGYLRGLRVELSRDRVSFLSPEELAAHEEQVARRIEGTRAAEKERAARRARAHPRRRRPSASEEDS